MPNKKKKRRNIKLDWKFEQYILGLIENFKAIKNSIHTRKFYHH